MPCYACLPNRLLKILCCCLLFFTWTLIPQHGWGRPVSVQVFVSKNCPYCHEVVEFLHELQDSCTELSVETHEIHTEKELWQDYIRTRELPAGIYPLTLIGEVCFVGYLKGDGPLEADPTGKAYLGYESQILKAIEAEGVNCTFTAEERGRDTRTVENTVGKIERRTEDAPFWYFASLLALADGFNPCAFTVLLILMSLLMHLRNRSLMLLITATFVLTGAIMYAVFIFVFLWVGGWFIGSYGYIVVRVLGIVVLTAGTMSVLEGIGTQASVSLALTSGQKASLSRRAGRIIHRLKPVNLAVGTEKRTLAIAGGIGATVMLSLAANLTELGCTAVLPMVFVSRLLGRYGSEIGVIHLGWITYYAGVYILPLAGVGLASILLLRRGRMSLAAGRVLKLVGGVVMCVFGLLMLLRPGVMG